MILRIYEWDSDGHYWNGPSERSDLRHAIENETLPPLIQVDKYSTKDYSHGHPATEPKAIIGSNGDPILVYVESKKQQEKYAEWCQEGIQHHWEGTIFTRIIEKPIWGYDISSIEEVELILMFFENIVQYAPNEIRIQN